jgi:nicotinamide-nucleotide amidase
MKVEIITIGDELLIGQVTDTNSAWMGNILNDNGFMVVRKTAVGDDEHDIINAIKDAHSRVSIVLLTGGLGPTKDDLTLKTLCKLYNCNLHFSEEVYQNIERLFGTDGRVMNELTRNQAMVPDKADVIQNKAGTAPCTWFEENGKMLVSLPGVPHEMTWLMANEIIPRLKVRFQQDMFIKHQTCWVAGYPESALAIKLTDFENRLPAGIKLAYLPQPGVIRLRLSAYCRDEYEAGQSIGRQTKLLKEILGNSIIAVEDSPIELITGNILRSRGLTLGTAESCTGGAIAARITSLAGSSDYFLGSVVSYSNTVKENVLGVKPEDLQQYGAVSQQVVEQMVAGAIRVLGCDYAIATSGIAGPGGGTPEKPVGTIWIAVASKQKVVSQLCRFSSQRAPNILRSVNMSLVMLLDLLNEEVK